MDDDQRSVSWPFRTDGAVELIAVSVVSHAHGAMVGRLVESLLACSEVTRVVVTKNVPESLSLPDDSRVKVVSNQTPKGFGANHNAAFQFCAEEYFCPLNPDIELHGNPFPQLIRVQREMGSAIVAPMVLSPAGAQEDSWRHFPTVTSLLRKTTIGDQGRYSVAESRKTFSPEWVAGMFMLFSRVSFVRLGGFDERFFLYYEDVDICVRAWKLGMVISACPQVWVVHDARRDSRRSVRHLRWHLKSMVRFFVTHWGRLPQVPR